MKKLEEMLREKPIRNKLSFVFRIMDVLYVVLALVAVVGLIQSKSYVGSVIVVIVVVLAIAFNAKAFCQTLISKSGSMNDIADEDNIFPTATCAIYSSGSVVI